MITPARIKCTFAKVFFAQVTESTEPVADQGVHEADATCDPRN